MLLSYCKEVSKMSINKSIKKIIIYYKFEIKLWNGGVMLQWDIISECY